MLEVGVKAPDFTLKDKDGKEAVSYTHLDVYKRQRYRARVFRRSMRSSTRRGGQRELSVNIRW